MKKFILFFITLSFFNISFAEDIFLISSSNSCVLVPPLKSNIAYLNSLNQTQNWTSYTGTGIIEKNITLHKFEVDENVCPNNIFLNEKDINNTKASDYITNKRTSSQPYSIVEVKDKNIIENTKKDILSWISKENNSSLQSVQFLKILSGFKYQFKDYLLVEIRSFLDFEQSPRKGEFSYVVLYSPDTKGIISVEPWFNQKLNDRMKIDNQIEGFLDIDNDGEYELMIRSSYYEGSASLLYKIINSKAVQKRACGCGG